MRTAFVVLVLALALAAGTLYAQPDPVTISPNSGSGFSGTFLPQLSWCCPFQSYSIKVYFGPSFSQNPAPGACVIRRSGFSTYLSTGVDSDGNETWTSAGNGSGVTLSNNYCRVVVNGSLPVTFLAPLSGTIGIWGWSWALGYSDGNDEPAPEWIWGWSQIGAWTVPAMTASTVSVTPSSGSGWSQTFSAVYSDNLGTGDLQNVSLWFRTSASVASNACNISYDNRANQIKLQDDAGSASTGATVGSATTLQNSQCIVNAQSVTVSPSGNNLTLNVPVTFKQAFSGAKQILLQAVGTPSAGPNQLGTWTVPGGAPASPVSVSPNAGNGMTQTFTAVFSDTLGATDIGTAGLDIAASTSSFAGVCDVNYLRGSNQLRLLNDAGNAWSYGTPGVGGTLQNSQCSIDTGATGVSANGNTLTISIPITFRPAFNGPKSTYLYVDSPSGTTGWQSRGTWNVTPLNISSVIPASGSGMTQTFSVNATDSNGYTDISTVWLYLTPSFNPNPAGACQVYYDRALNYVFLMNDTGTSAIPALIGSSATVSNSQCSFSAANSSVSASGNLLTVNFAITFAGANSGLKQTWVMAKNASTDSGWMNMGAWNVVVQAGDFSISAAPASRAVAQGGSAPYTITVNTNTPGSTVTIQASGAPPNGSATVSPTQINGSGSVSLTVATTTSTPVGTYTITITGTSGAYVHTATVTLQVQTSAAYTFYQTDGLSSINTTYWSQAGAVTPTADGLKAPDASGGSVISKISAPDGTSEYDIRATIRLTASGGTYTLFARATADARTGGSGSGTYLAFEMRGPTLDANGNCSANYVLLRSISGNVTALSSFAAGCWNGMTLRLVARSSMLLAYIGGWQAAKIDNPGIAGGQPGVGGYATPSGNAIYNVQVGPLDRSAPHTIDPSSVGTATFSNRIEMQWQGVADDPAGVGLWTYILYRDGAYFGMTPQPNFADETVAAGSTHSYQIYASDQHYNWSTPISLNLTAAPAGATEPRRVGVRPEGAYWGGGGEQIDLRSGNLNYTLPVLKAVARGGWTVGLSLSYNSQQWRQDSGGTWKLGRDVGYGFGWKLMAGSITPVYQGTWAIHHYVFTDSTGAEYRLDINNNNVWTSREGFYGSFDANTSCLYFPDGTRWDMWAQSGGDEEDAGTLYPTVFRDTNGNRIEVSYMPGAGVGGWNTSARLYRIFDARCPYTWVPVYVFNYSSEPTPHLVNITAPWGIPTMDSASFTYLRNQSLLSPFTAAPLGTTTLLQVVTPMGLNISTTMQYTQSSGELTQVTTPLGGSLTWGYRTFTYAGGRSYREAQSRQVTTASGAAPWSWSISLDSNTTLHAAATVADAGAGTQKVWTFASSGPYLGLTAAYEERDATAAALLRKEYTWTQDGNGRPYVGAVVTTLNPGTAYAAQTKTTQALDIYGNVTQSAVYPYGNLATPARTYNYTYLHQTNANYAPRYIFNRMTQATVTPAGGSASITASLTYDGASPRAQDGAGFHDDANYGAGFNYRGNLTSRWTPAGNASTQYYSTGVVYSSTNEGGVAVSNATASGTNYSLPSVITPNGQGSLATSLSYNSAWEVTSVTGANGANSTTAYDQWGRPSQSTMADGAQTIYTYTYNPNTQTATLGTRWTRKTLDGFGRTTKVETGHDSVTVSVAESEYAPCACSPLGKLWRTSRPHAPGTSPQWTTYTYDGMGRTLTVTLPDGSVTRYEYTGNTTKVTDAASKWKKQTSDVFGNLALVTEPNPAGGADWTTSYTYDVLDHLTRVEMPRAYNGGTYTQVRTFTWNGHNLASETNPETGAITYVYDGYQRLTSRTDAKGQQRQYSYDSFGRLTQKRYYLPDQYGTLQEQARQRVDYHYDTNPIDGQYTQNGWGRLTSAEFTGPDISGRATPLKYEYSYNQAGRVVAQRMQVYAPNSGDLPWNLDDEFAHLNWPTSLV